MQRNVSHQRVACPGFRQLVRSHKLSAIGFQRSVHEPELHHLEFLSIDHLEKRAEN
jgi:hypothetical protein